MATAFIDLGVIGVHALLVTSNGTPVGLQTENGFAAIVSGPYLKASLPTAVQAGQPIYVSNATGLHVTGSLCFWNGTSWIDVTTGNAVV